MPPKRKTSIETPKKRLKFARVLSPTSYAVKQSSPRKTKGGAKLGGVIGPSMTMVNNSQATFASNNIATASTGVSSTATVTRKAKEQLDEDTIAVRSTAQVPAATTVTAKVTRQSAVAAPIDPIPPPPPPQSTEADEAVAYEIVQTLAPTVKTRGSRNARLTGGNDENSPFLTFRAVPKPRRKNTAAARTSIRGTSKTSAEAPTSAAPPAEADNIFDPPSSEDDLSKAKDSPFLASLEKASPQPPPNPVLSSMTSQVTNSAPVTTVTGKDNEKPAEKDVFIDGNPAIAPRRGRGRPRGSKNNTTASSTRKTPAVPPPPAFILPSTPAARSPPAEDADSTEDDEANTIPAPPPPPPKAKRGRKSASAAASNGTREPPLPEVSATDLAPRKSAPATRGRGGRGRGSTRGRGRTARGRPRKPVDPPPREEPIAQFAPIPTPTQAPVAQMSSAAYEAQAQPDSLTFDQAVSVAAARKPKSTYDGPVTELGVKLLKKHVLGKVSGRGKMKIMGFEEEYGHVYHLLEQTVVSGEGNSMLVIGPRGVGKSTLVDTAISSLQQSHSGQFLTVRLSGFLQTDDKLALREIWRQLGVEMDLEEQGGQPRTSNFADTLTSFLALLSHPDDLAPDNNDSEGDNEGRKTSLSVVFILDEFDLFVTHPRQTLLYNLFDIAQARKAPIAVLGLTSRIDIVEGLEKRVKSRFSHRSVHLRLPNSLDHFWGIIRSGLEIDEKSIGDYNDVSGRETGYWERWNDTLDTLWEENKGFRRLIRRAYALSKDVKGFWSSYCIYPISHLISKENPYLTEEMLHSGTTKETKDRKEKEKEKEKETVNVSLSAPENKLHILPALTELELSLLIAAARLDIILDTDTCNFNMAYDEYRSLAAKVKVQNSIGSTIAGGGIPGGGQGGKLWSREVAVGAWEGLGGWGIIVPVTAGGSGGGLGREGRMWRVEVGLGEIGRWAGGGGGGGLGGVLGKWCREI